MFRTYRFEGHLSAICATALLVSCAPDDAAVADAESDKADGYHGVVVNPPFVKPDFVLTDTDGEPFDFGTETDGRVALLFFGYTHCPDFCPVQLANIGAVLGRFPYDVRSRVRVVFVTTDPERDTPERIREWLDGFDPSFVGLRGDTAEVARIQRALMMPATIREQTPDAGNYRIGHASSVVAFTADGAGRVIYPFGVRQEQWEHDIPRLVRQPSDGS